MSLFDDLSTNVNNPSEFLRLANAASKADFITALGTQLPDGRFFISDLIKNQGATDPNFIHAIFSLLTPAELEQVLGLQNTNKTANTAFHTALHYLPDMLTLFIVNRLSKDFLHAMALIKNGHGWHFLHTAARNQNNRYTMTALAEKMDADKLSAAYAEPTGRDGRTMMHFGEHYQGQGETKCLTLKVNSDALAKAAAHRARDGWTGWHTVARNAEAAEFIMVLARTNSRITGATLRQTNRDGLSFLYMALRNQPAICILALLRQANYRQLSDAIPEDRTLLNDAISKNKHLKPDEIRNMQTLLAAVKEFTNISRDWNTSLTANTGDSSQIATYLNHLHELARTFNGAAQNSRDIAANERDILEKIQSIAQSYTTNFNDHLQAQSPAFRGFHAWFSQLAYDNPQLIRNVVRVVLANHNLAQLVKLADPSAVLPASPAIQQQAAAVTPGTLVDELARAQQRSLDLLSGFAHEGIGARISALVNRERSAAYGPATAANAAATNAAASSAAQGPLTQSTTFRLMAAGANYVAPALSLGIGFSPLSAFASPYPVAFATGANSSASASAPHFYGSPVASSPVANVAAHAATVNAALAFSSSAAMAAAAAASDASDEPANESAWNMLATGVTSALNAGAAMLKPAAADAFAATMNLHRFIPNASAAAEPAIQGRPVDADLIDLEAAFPAVNLEDGTELADLRGVVSSSTPVDALDSTSAASAAAPASPARRTPSPDRLSVAPNAGMYKSAALQARLPAAPTTDPSDAKEARRELRKVQFAL